MRRLIIVIAFTGGVLTSSDVAAQRSFGKVGARLPSAQQHTRDGLMGRSPYDSTTWLMRSTGYGIGFGALGAGVGLLGASLVSDDPGSLLVGALLIESFTLPVGVHSGNGNQGSLSWSVVASYGWASAGVVYAGTKGTDDAYLIAAIASPALQLLTSLLIEAVTSK